jgi:hypothetical protein
MSDFNLDDYEEISERELHERYDEFLNEINPEVFINGFGYDPADCLKHIDPIAYRRGFNDWLDSESDTYIEHNGEYYVKK